LLEAGGDIREAQQFDDATNRFFMRMVFEATAGMAALG
jgi:formyltetrahydrofolate hydrolase